MTSHSVVSRAGAGCLPNGWPKIHLRSNDPDPQISNKPLSRTLHPRHGNPAADPRQTLGAGPATCERTELQQGGVLSYSTVQKIDPRRGTRNLRAHRAPAGGPRV